MGRGSGLSCRALDNIKKSLSLKLTGQFFFAKKYCTMMENDSRFVALKTVITFLLASSLLLECVVLFWRMSDLE